MLKADAANASVDKIKSFLRNVAKKWVFQKEKGEETGFVHYQIRLSVKMKGGILPGKMLKLLNHEYKPGFGKMSVTSEDEAKMMLTMGVAFYCMKAETRIEGPWMDTDETQTYVQKRFREPKFNGWQLELKKKMDAQYRCNNDRNIILVVNKSGGVGKSWFRGCMKQKYGWLTVPPTCQNPQEMVQYLCSNPKIKDGWKGYIMCDVPRAVSPKHWYTLAQGLEVIKQGELYDGRYSMTEKIIEPPAMCVFVNSEPPEGVMSSDVFRMMTIEPPESPEIDKGPNPVGEEIPCDGDDGSKGPLRAGTPNTIV